jgi:cytidylate kinase
MIITIDGPIATGKSTIARGLAHRLGFIFFDTGAMYRCVAYGMLKKGIDVDNHGEVEVFLRDFNFDINIYRGEKKYIVFGKDVSEEIRGEAVTSLVPKVSAIKGVRDKLVAMQRKLSIGVNAVFEGRDMGTVVFPKAEIKIFLTGRPEVRAKRRFEELKARFPEDTKDLTIEKTLKEIQQRDYYDSTREISPLRQAEDAHVVDTSDLSVDEVIYKILEIVDSLPAN